MQRHEEILSIQNRIPFDGALTPSILVDVIHVQREIIRVSIIYHASRIIFFNTILEINNHWETHRLVKSDLRTLTTMDHAIVVIIVVVKWLVRKALLTQHCVMHLR